MHPSHRFLWLAVCSSLAANVVLAVGYVRLAGRPVPAATPTPAKVAPYHDRIEAGQIVLRPAGGRPVASWEVGRDGMGSHLRFLNGDGNPVFGLRSNGVDSVISWLSGDGHVYARAEGKTVNPMHGQFDFRLTNRDYQDQVIIQGPTRPTVSVAK